MTKEVIESAMNTSDERVDEESTETEVVTLDKMKQVKLTVVAKDVMKNVVGKVNNC